MKTVAKIRHPKKRAFLRAYAETASIKRACEAAQIDRETQRHWRMQDPVFLAAFEAAREEAGETLEAEAVRRAYEGIEEPVTIAGERELIRRYSDVLLIFMLKGTLPAKYRERYEHTGANGSPLFGIQQFRDYLAATEPKDDEATTP